MPISHNRCNHITIGHEDRSIRLVHFPWDGAPTIVWVARSWGLPVPFLLFPEEFVTVALSGYSEHIHEGLSIIFPPSADRYLLPTFADGTNTPGISAPGEPGLSSTHVNMSRDYSPFHVLFLLTTKINISQKRECGH